MVDVGIIQPESFAQVRDVHVPVADVERIDNSYGETGGMVACHDDGDRRESAVNARLEIRVDFRRFGFD